MEYVILRNVNQQDSFFFPLARLLLTYPAATFQYLFFSIVNFNKTLTLKFADSVFQMTFLFSSLHSLYSGVHCSSCVCSLFYGSSFYRIEYGNIQNITIFVSDRFKMTVYWFFFFVIVICTETPKKMCFVINSCCCCYCFFFCCSCCAAVFHCASDFN